MHEDLRISLLGFHQIQNAAVAVTLFAIMLVYIIYQLRRMLRDER